MKRFREMASDMLVMAGLGMLVFASFLIHPIAGWIVSGLVLIGLGVVLGMEGKR